MILAEQALRWAQRKFYLMLFWLRNLTFKIVFFQFFPKSRKVAILFCRFHHENSIPRKNEVHHKKANGKSNKTVDSDFWFLKLCHRDFSPQSSLLLKKYIFSDFMIRIFVFAAKNILSNFFVRAIKYTKMFGPLCSLFCHIDIENLLIRLKAVMVSLKTSETEDYYHKIGKSIFRSESSSRTRSCWSVCQQSWNKWSDLIKDF